MSYITRHFVNGKFVYKSSKKEDIPRIKDLKIPPMWTNVKIDKSSKAKIQATGYDSKGRKQYIYHPDFIEEQQEVKFQDLINFGKSIKRIRKDYMGIIESNIYNKLELNEEKIISLVLSII